MTQYQRVGVHVSAAGGVENAPENARELGAECFQFFSRSPRGGAAPTITKEQASLFRERCEEHNFESYIHTPYYINFASKKKLLAAAAPRIIREELERGSLLGVKYVVTHLGSAFEWDDSMNGQASLTAIQQVVEGIKAIYAGNKTFTTRLLLEISAGSGAVIGDTFEELVAILEAVGRNDVHICLDTCHMLASGYDIRTKETLDATMSQFDKTIGLSQLKLAHINDSKTDLGSHKDRHEHIGDGKIGYEGFKHLLTHPAFRKVNFIIETPHDQKITNDIDLLKKWRVA